MPVPQKVMLTGLGPFMAADVPTKLWNGWLQPRFSKEQLQPILDALKANGELEEQEWKDSMLFLTLAGCDPEPPMEADKDGLFSFCGWTFDPAPEA
jgi:hypothetical protein